MSRFLQSIIAPVKYWYLILIVGVLFIVFGVYIFTVPLETYLSLSILFSVSFIISGASESLFSFQNRDTLSGWGWYLVSGLLTLAIGIYMAVYPEISIVTLPYFVGFTLLFRSFQALGISFDMREMKIVSWGNLALASVAGILFSILLIAHPIFTGLSLVSLTALSFLFAGVATILLSLNLKKLKGLPQQAVEDFKKKIATLENEVSSYYEKIK